MSDPKELEIEFSPEVLAQMENDPDMAAAIREFSASLRQADHAVKTGQHKTFEDAIEAITGNRPERLSDDEADAVMNEREGGDA